MRIQESESSSRIHYETEFTEGKQMKGVIDRFDPNKMTWLNLLLLTEISDQLRVLNGTLAVIATKEAFKEQLKREAKKK
jgi:hypothetical protein